MSCTVVITQPTYLPWTGYFEQVARADKFIFLDSVQFDRRSWQCRNRLKDHRDEVFWLTVPLAAHSQKTLIQDIRVSPDQPQWRHKHLSSMRACLGQAPFFDGLFPRFEAWLGAGHTSLAELNMAGIRMIAGLLGLAPEFVRASELGVTGQKTGLLVGLCQRVGATHYYSSLGSKDYLEEHQFAEAGMALEYQTWPHPEYAQFGRTFVSHLSVVDALMHVGAAQVREWIVAPGPVERRGERPNGERQV